MNIYDLSWEGPIQLGRDFTDKLPDKGGIYLFSNSSSPFLVQAHEVAVASGDPSLSKPRILYIGMTSHSLKKRLGQHIVAQKASMDFSKVFVYWLEDEEPRHLEKLLIMRFQPLLNATGYRRGPAEDGIGQINVVSAGIKALEDLLQRQVETEADYQQVFVKFPFLLGGTFSKIQPHQALDNENIPDFTGVRSKDGHLDVIEIKQPFLQLTSNGNELRCEFHRIWHQAERYLDFVRTESDYLLRQKHLSFDNPYCYLIASHKPDDFLRKEISRKRRINPGIVHLTYDEVLSMARSYQVFMEQISSVASP